MKNIYAEGGEAVSKLEEYAQLFRIGTFSNIEGEIPFYENPVIKDENIIEVRYFNANAGYIFAPTTRKVDVKRMMSEMRKDGYNRFNFQESDDGNAVMLGFAKIKEKERDII
jgi:hypothetical protein